MESTPDDIQAMGCAIHQFWIDRVNECTRAGVLKDGEPMEVGMTLWAHAHGLVQLFQRGRLNTDEAGFRRLVKESGARLFSGLMTDDFAERVGELVGVNGGAPHAGTGAENGMGGGSRG